MAAATLTLRAGTKLRLLGVWVTLTVDTVVQVAQEDAGQLAHLAVKE